MNRPFYSDFVRHTMRYYARNPQQPRFRSEADRDREILTAVYGGYDTLSDNVYEVAKKHNINQSIIWDMMKEFERKVAKRRGLM